MLFFAFFHCLHDVHCLFVSYRPGGVGTGTHKQQLLSDLASFALIEPLCSLVYYSSHAAMFSRPVSLRCGLALLQRELRPPTWRAVRPLPLPSPIHRLALATFSNASPSPSVAESKEQVKTVKGIVSERVTPAPATTLPVDEQEPDVSNLPPEERGRYKKFTIPNVLCVARIVLTPYIGHLVVTQQFTPAFGLFVVAGLTDMLDGQIARRVPGQKSLLGSVLDPVADKLLVSTMFVTLSYAGLLPVAVTGVVILRDVCLITGGFVKRYQSLVRERIPISLSVFFSPRVSSMQVVPTMMSKINTVLQLGLVASALASPVLEFGDMANQGVHGLCWLTAFTTVYSGLQYASGRAFKKIK